METVPQDHVVQVAILFERLGHVMEKMNNLAQKLDDMDTKNVASTTELEKRIGHVEKQLNSFRWFLTGIAMGGGLLGGSVAAMIAQIVAG